MLRHHFKKHFRSFFEKDIFFSNHENFFPRSMIGDPRGVRRARIEGVREGNSGACLQHVWPVAKEVGKRGGNNRHD